MDSHFTASREDLYHVQMDVKHVQAVQNNHADRLLRLERRQADDAALKSVWGPSPPFPGILSGTPQHGPVHNTSADVFDDFDDEQGHNLLGSLQIEADEEPVRRGASRANSVRFDVSALQGSNWAAGSRNSGEFAPTRPNSGFGSHPMTERSLSHKSDGRHSSAGHSVHSMHSASGRTSSLGLDTNFMIGGQDDDSPLDTPDPPPGLFILGSVPSIIRCWLTADFSHNSLLYATVCTGSQRSVLDYSLVKDLGLADQVHRSSNGRHTIKLPVYLPEAIITQPTSRSNSPAPHLPALSADFEIVGMAHRGAISDRKKMRVFLGSDTLRAHNADILLSQNVMVMYDDDRNKLSVPFVRPEDENMFKNLMTTNVIPERNELKATAPPFTPTESKPKIEPTPDAVTSALVAGVENMASSTNHKIVTPTESQLPLNAAFAANDDVRERASSLKSVAGINGSVNESEKQQTIDSSTTETEPSEPTTSESSRRESSGGIWGSWRQSGSINGSETESVSGYQRATRGGRSMKVLKPSTKSATTPVAVPLRSTSSARSNSTYEPPPPPRASGELRRKSQASGTENVPLRWETKRTSSEEQKATRSIATVPRSSNPIGGASAFAWMNPGKPKASATAE
ncbi:hypothetical protein VTL71DRAFT_4668 [Oculimacula yallundae]|uniref:Ubiquitin carboxyl-terminal hydrolase 19 n=1 Tax=Oculimacula yallundae TaxID=86028 RepID=A0ABR4C4D5_9HELO